MKMQRGTVSAGGCIYPVKRPSSMAATGNNGLENGSGTSLYVEEGKRELEEEIHSSSKKQSNKRTVGWDSRHYLRISALDRIPEKGDFIEFPSTSDSGASIECFPPS
ncbi:hypothetical protein I7I53_03866 [Histoplasma capsulatum var. duboisii H88]|uniref:Uncharacterized protein n=1 Tax=Ajellomyces capsulatus (strain H88) TaxID=544711 RepID=A0A8A1LPK8_AJEC8|nr:hypothetical protein I7I53_03866 [Histoplasma capsulatum var. duboisii H88]